MIKIILSGICGQMGKIVCETVRQRNDEFQIVSGIDLFPDGSQSAPTVTSFADAERGDADILIDFSHHSVTGDLLTFAKKNSLPVILATTGQTDEEKKLIEEASKEIPIFFAANYSMGILSIMELAKRAGSLFPDAEVEIIETHHDRKIDAPSGTALILAEAIKTVRPDANIVTGRSGIGKRDPKDIGISSVRIGNVVGTHEILIGTQSQTISLKHEAHSRGLFAEGALAAARYLIGKPAGLYDMNHLMKE